MPRCNRHIAQGDILIRGRYRSRRSHSRRRRRSHSASERARVCCRISQLERARIAKRHRIGNRRPSCKRNGLRCCSGGEGARRHAAADIDRAACDTIERQCLRSTSDSVTYEENITACDRIERAACAGQRDCPGLLSIITVSAKDTSIG